MPTKTALVVGIDEYGGPPNDLSCAVKDADAFARALQTTYGFDEVHSLRNNDATVERTDAELRWLFGGRTGNDRVVFYFSGHGFTRIRDGAIEECLVLRNGLFDSERFLKSASDLPAGICTAILDTSFTGVLELYAADASKGTPEVETIQPKVWRPGADEAARTGVAESDHKVTEFRRFACRPISSAFGIATALAARSQAISGAHSGAWPSGRLPLGIAPAAYPFADEGQLGLGGLLVCATLDNESAAANASRTEGHSAFTHALLAALRQLGSQASTAEIVAATHARLNALGIRQSPRLMEQPAPGDLRLRRFLTLEPISAAETLRVLAEPRYWEGVLTAASPQGSSAWAVSQEVNQMTMQQPLAGAYQPALGGYPQPLGATQYATDELSRTVSAIGPALATAIPAIVPQIVNSVLAQQRFLPAGGYVPGLTTPAFASPTPFGYGGGIPFGVHPHPLATADDVQRILPVLTPILSSVIPAVVPQIVNNILAQQRAMSVPWANPYAVLDAWQSVAPTGFQTTPAFQAPFGRM